MTQLLEARGRRAVRDARGLEVFKAPAHGLCLDHCFYYDGPGDVVPEVWRGHVDALHEDGVGEELASDAAESGRCATDAGVDAKGSAPAVDLV